MKGAIFIALNELIEDQFGITTWETLLDKVQPASKGVYTSTEDYPDAEMTAFVLAISEHTGMSTAEVTRTFGLSLFQELNRKFPVFSELNPNLFAFLKSVEEVIHKEVRKLYDNTSLPSIESEQVSEKTLRLHYRSERKLCFLAEGLIQGAAQYFDEPISLHHSACMHHGAEACILEVTKNE
jgi:predicted hydrocarbon binding protein